MISQCWKCYGGGVLQHFDTHAAQWCDVCHGAGSLYDVDFIFSLPEGQEYVGYDIETYPNIFTLDASTPDGARYFFEISEWRNDLDLLVKFIDRCRIEGKTGVGFNSMHFDYPVIHWIYQNRRSSLSVADIYAKAMSIINAPYNARFAHVVWESDHLFPQLDLFKVHHFDNKAKSTSLKVLEFNMRSLHLEDLPFPVGTHLTADQAPKLRTYNHRDVEATLLFLDKSSAQITMRKALTAKFNDSMMNCSDVKIGEKILLASLQTAGVECFVYSNGKKLKKQTHRESIDINQVIFPYVRFQRQEFQQIHSELQSKVITETKGIFKNMVAAVDGLEYKFGTGGLHASLDKQIVHSDELNQIVDIDVASFYPNLGIKNRLYPAHLGEEFCTAYDEVFHTRRGFKKGTPENEAYKLALNGAYGNSNNEYSTLFDSFYTMSITINGQLLLCMLVEQLIKTPGLKMIQANTDGVTFICPKAFLTHVRAVCRWWELLTQLQLEEQLYKSMFIRDVNNYIAVKEDGKVKRIGAYAYETALENPGTRELPWHKDWSFRVIAKATEAHLVHGTPLREFIKNHNDVYDFLGRTKVPRSSVLMHGNEQVQNTVRYYVATGGRKLEKVMPAKEGMEGQFKKSPKVSDAEYFTVMKEIGPGVWDARIHTQNKSVHEDRVIGIHTGWGVTLCNDLSGAEWFHSNYHPDDLNYEYYIKQAEKLVHLMKHDNEPEEYDDGGA